MRPIVVQQSVIEMSRLFLGEVRHARGKVCAVDALGLAPHPEAGQHEAALEPAAQRRLQPFVVRIAAVVPHADAAVTTIRSQEVVGQRRVSRNAARDTGRILILRLERRAKRQRVDLHLPEQIG